MPDGRPDARSLVLRGSDAGAGHPDPDETIGRQLGRLGIRIRRLGRIRLCKTDQVKIIQHFRKITERFPNRICAISFSAFSQSPISEKQESPQRTVDQVFILKRYQIKRFSGQYISLNFIPA